MTDDRRRIERVAGLIRLHLSELFRRELGDPELSSVVVAGVEVTKDLSLARVRVQSLAGSGSAEASRRLMGKVRKAAPRLRRALGPRLDLRRVPELRFEIDGGRDASARVSELLDEIARDPKGEAT